MTAGRGRRDCGKRTRPHGHGQQGGDCWGEGGIRELNGKGKNTIKIQLKNKDDFSWKKKDVYSSYLLWQKKLEIIICPF